MLQNICQDELDIIIGFLLCSPKSLCNLRATCREYHNLDIQKNPYINRISSKNWFTEIGMKNKSQIGEYTISGPISAIEAKYLLTRQEYDYKLSSSKHHKYQNYPYTPNSLHSYSSVDDRDIFSDSEITAFNILKNLRSNAYSQQSGHNNILFYSNYGPNSEVSDACLNLAIGNNIDSGVNRQNIVLIRLLLFLVKNSNKYVDYFYNKHISNVTRWLYRERDNDLEKAIEKLKSVFNLIVGIIREGNLLCSYELLELRKYIIKNFK